MLSGANFKKWREFLSLYLGALDLDYALRNAQPLYTGKGNIREYIMEMSHIHSKLKGLNLELPEESIVYMALNSLPPQFSQFKVSYNCQKDPWSLNELISHCVQEEERRKSEQCESAHLTVASSDKSKDKGKRKGKQIAGVPPKKKLHKEVQEI
ncbi:uncharacterized protein LOC144704984 [Wolffia australiana]